MTNSETTSRAAAETFAEIIKVFSKALSILGVPETSMDGEDLIEWCRENKPAAGPWKPSTNAEALQEDPADAGKKYGESRQYLWFTDAGELIVSHKTGRELWTCRGKVTHVADINPPTD